MIINHNISALNTYRQLTTNNLNQNKSLEKLSSGLRINRAGDDAAGLAISEKMRGQIRGLEQASRNAQDAISLIQTAEGALNETHSILQRMRELAVQASSDTNSAVDRDEIQKEINQLTSEINRIGNTTEFNTKKLLNGDFANTLATVTGNFGSASGAATSSVSGIGGLTAVNFTGDGLTSGSHTVTISRVGEDHENQALVGADYTADSSGATDDVTFGGSVITFAAGAEDFVASGFSISFDYAAQTVTITGSGASGTIDDTVALTSGKLNYDNFGISFSIDTTNASGDALFAFSGQVTGAMTLGTAREGYAAANSGNNNWISGNSIAIGTPNVSGTLSGAGDLPDTAVEWTITLSGASGANGFRISGVGADGTVYQDAVATNLAGAANNYTYNGYGLSFTVSGDGGADGDQIEFTTTPTFTYSMSVDGGSGIALASGVGSDGLAGTFSGGGISFTAANVLSEGSSVTGSFNVFTSYSTGSDDSMTFQIGANENQSMSLDVTDMRSVALGISSITSGAGFTSDEGVTDGTNSTNVEYALNVTTSSDAANAISVINNAIESVSAERSKLGAYQNRLEHTINNLGTSSENLTAAESRIRDVDMAKEMMQFTKNTILQQASTAMLAQANQQPQSVLQLLG